jgi:hypothetical protein
VQLHIFKFREIFVVPDAWVLFCCLKKKYLLKNIFCIASAYLRARAAALSFKKNLFKNIFYIASSYLWLRTAVHTFKYFSVNPLTDTHDRPCSGIIAFLIPNRSSLAEKDKKMKQNDAKKGISMVQNWSVISRYGERANVTLFAWLSSFCTYTTCNTLRETEKKLFALWNLQ